VDYVLFSVITVFVVTYAVIDHLDISDFILKLFVVAHFIFTFCSNRLSLLGTGTISHHHPFDGNNPYLNCAKTLKNKIGNVQVFYFPIFAWSAGDWSFKLRLVYRFPSQYGTNIYFFNPFIPLFNESFCYDLFKLTPL